jgi:glycosyltransferase involved in cell wall biosynthesis
MDVPLVSVEMITYNHAPYVAQAIEGVVKQEVDFPIELVIGEDCSPDGTQAIVLDYQKKHAETIRVVTSERNVGAWANVRRTRGACRGKYIAYCEGDDYWHHPGKLKAQVDYLEAHPECGLVHSDVDVVDVATGKRSCRQRTRLTIPCEDGDANLPWWILSGRYAIWTCSVCARKELVDRVTEANPDLFGGNRFLLGDLPLWFELSRASHVHFIDESMATYRVLPESASRSRDASKQLRFALSGRDVRVYCMQKYSCPAEMEKAILKPRAEMLLDAAYRARDYQTAREAAAELVRLGSRLSAYQRLLLCGSHRWVGPILDPVIVAGQTAAHWLRRQIRGNP